MDNASVALPMGHVSCQKATWDRAYSIASSACASSGARNVRESIGHWAPKKDAVVRYAL